jgi:hypothetical protein
MLLVLVVEQLVLEQPIQVTVVVLILLEALV